MDEQIEPERIRILYVDDEVDSVEVFTNLLVQLGCESQGCRDATECLASARGFRPHLILIDLAMPGMSGFELVSAVKAHVSPLPLLVAVSGYADNATRDRCLLAGFHQHEPKPLRIDHLHELLDAARDMASLE